MDDDDNMADASELSELDTQEMAELATDVDNDEDVLMADTEEPQVQGINSDNEKVSSPPQNQAQNGVNSTEESQPSTKVERLQNGKRRKVTKTRRTKPIPIVQQKTSEPQSNDEESNPIKTS